VGFVTLTLSNVGSANGVYRSGFVYDFTWILPFAFFPWAATAAPASDAADAAAIGSLIAVTVGAAPSVHAARSAERQHGVGEVGVHPRFARTEPSP